MKRDIVPNVQVTPAKRLLYNGHDCRNPSSFVVPMREKRFPISDGADDSTTRRQPTQLQKHRAPNSGGAHVARRRWRDDRIFPPRFARDRFGRRRDARRPGSYTARKRRPRFGSVFDSFGDRPRPRTGQRVAEYRKRQASSAPFAAGRRRAPSPSVCEILRCGRYNRTRRTGLPRLVSGCSSAGRRMVRRYCALLLIIIIIFLLK